jgi:hypothetical protein
MAIHDAHYATPAPDWPSLCYRLQYLAEMRVGTRVRQSQAQVDAAFDRVANEIG